jgi:type 1 glutamine amidotransferase
MKQALFVFLLPAALAALPHHEQIAPGVWAAGFADKYGSATCGWMVRGGETLLIDLPRGVEVNKFLEEVAALTGRPVRSFALTARASQDEALIAALEKAGVNLVMAGEGVPLERAFGGTARALYFADKRVLFAGPAVVHGPRAVLPGTNTAAWLDALAVLKTKRPARVVPGRGSWGGPDLLDRQQRFLSEIRRQVAYGISLGRALEKITGAVLLPASYFTWMPYDNPRPEDIRHVYEELTAPRAPYYGKPPQRSKQKPHALVLIADRYHEPEHIEDGLRPVFAATGVTPHFLVDYRALNAENLAHVDLLVILRDGMVWPDDFEKPAIWMTPAQEKAVVDFVEGGGAFLNLHNSMGVYPENGPYLNLVGGRYIGHGPLERFLVEVADQDHPITRGVTPFFAADEQHTPPYDEKRVRLLLRNRSDDGKTAAAGWCHEPGQGRLVHLASGHTREALEHPMFQLLMRNAVNWLLRR